MTERAPFSFYVPEDASFTILDSALASIRYALAVCDDPGDGSLRCRSVTTTPDGTLVRYRGRLLEGVGYCADSIFAANHVIRTGLLLDDQTLVDAGRRLARHSLLGGFFDDPLVPVRLYRDSESGEFLDNLEARPDYVELGHMARVGHQLLKLKELLEPTLAAKAVAAVERLIEWLQDAEKCSNGWFPRRATPSGRVYDRAPDALGPVTLPPPFPPDPLFDCSGAGSFVIQLYAEAHAEGIAGLEAAVTTAVDAFVKSGGHFGSTNTDTEDRHENVSYAIAYLALERAATALGRADWATFALESCLRPLEGFELREDVGGMNTKGLLFMERSWNSACMWELAMAAQAYFAAYRATGRRDLVLKGLTILRAAAKHHHGELGFLTEAVDWDGHSVAARHFEGAARGDINDTHPFLNNLHIVEPTLSYLHEWAYRLPDAEGDLAFFDLEGNRLGAVRQSIELKGAEFR